ncbi:MAG TPA: glycosyltransferase 87 family protein [Chthoniobacter sp.]|nr:glycosyltransferase 87 family protein [Chthoniobacter sp.]
MKPRTIVLLLAIAALVAKLYCAATTIGSSDVVFFYQFAHMIHERGLLAMYEASIFFNHTPLVGWFSDAAYTLAGANTPDPDAKRYFVFYLRLPAIFADFFGVIALLWYQEKTGRPLWWALALYAASPVGFMVSGYHGNVDSVMALGILLAGIACAVDRPAIAGLCLGFACNIKIIPLILIPAFFFLCWQRRQALRFTIPLILTVLIGWSYPLLTIPKTFLKDVLGYGSIWGVWGITYLLRLTGHPALREIAFVQPTEAQTAIITGLKVLIVALAVVVAWRRRRAEPAEIFQTLAVIWAVFFVFAPGFGAQYLAWIMPCFLLANERWYAVLTVASSVALFVFYNAISGGMPWWQGLKVHSIANQWTPALVLPWLVLTAFLGWQAWRAVEKPVTEAETQTA